MSLSSNPTVGSVEVLESVVGTRPLGSMMKTLDALDAHCVRLLSLSPFAVIGCADGRGRARATAVGGEPGFTTIVDATHLRIPLDADFDVGSSAGCALLFFIPGLGETLRVNGRVTRDGATVLVTVEEAFAHCAKAILRSSLWQAASVTPVSPARDVPPGVLDDPDVREMLGATPFLVLVSWDAGGRADASPKGDPPGFLAMDQGRIAIADRPGNRRTDTFHNVVEQPRVAMLALIPGDGRVLEVSGSASLTTEPALLASLAVADKTPKIALLLEPEHAEVRRSSAIAAARLWDESRHVPRDARPDMAEVFVAHVKRNRERGAGATAIRTLASKRVMGWALAKDYEKNRY